MFFFFASGVGKFCWDFLQPCTFGGLVQHASSCFGGPRHKNTEVD